MPKEKLNKKRAQNVINFIEYLTVPSGIGAGKQFKLRKFQKNFIYDVYAPEIRGKRRVRRAILSMARKNGKSALISCLVLAHLFGPESILNGEIYSAATERDQAALVFKMAAQIVRAYPVLEAEVKIVESTKTMVHYKTGSFYRAISAEASSKFGFNPTLVIYDELAQAKNRDLFDALDTSMGAREEPLFIAISTQSPSPDHILSLLIDDGLSKNDPSTVVHLYETPDNADPWDEKNWYLSNPALDDFRSLEDMRILAHRAKRMPSFESPFRNLFLNQRVSSDSPFISRSIWDLGNKPIKEIEKDSEIYCGLDLSSKTDLTAFIMLWLVGGEWQIRSFFWTPEYGLAERSKRDRVPYDCWVRDNYIFTTPGKTVDYEYVAKNIFDITKDYVTQIIGISFDRWRMDILQKEFDKLHLGINLYPYGQGYKDQTHALDAMEEAFLNGKVAHGNNPVLRMCASNAIAVSDPAGNRKLDKSKSVGRIDGIAAMANAFGYARLSIDERSCYENKGIVFL